MRSDELTTNESVTNPPGICHACCRDVGFVAAAFLVLAVVLVNLMGGALGIWELPGESALEGREYTDIQPVLNLHSVKNGRFQSKMDRLLSDRVVARDEVLLANAAFQRHVIELARLPLGYDIYPTFFQSERVYCGQYDAVYPFPAKQRQFSDGYWHAIGESLGVLAANADERINWRLALVERADNTVSAPTHDLVSEPADYYYIEDELSRIVPESFELVDLHVGDAREYAQQYFRTDHHMQVQGSVIAYEKVLKSLGRTPERFDDFFAAFDGQYFGSNARVGLCDLAWDVVYDVAYDRKNLKITADGKKGNYHTVDLLFSKDGKPYQKKSRFSNIGFHRKHFKLIEYENLDLPESSGSLLLIGDSYLDNCGRFYAKSYRHVYELDPRYYEGSLKEFIAAHEIDDAVIYGSLETLDTDAAQNCLRS